MPEASIVIRTFNEEKHLGNLLRSLRTQSYQKFEVIVVDSGSTDQTLDIAREFKTKIISIESRDFTFGHSLNVGCREARGNFLVFVSAHVLPASDTWLENLLRPFSDKKVAMVYGRQMGDSGAKFSEKRDFEKLFGGRSFTSLTTPTYPNNANSAIRRELWEKSKFDEYLFGLEDIDWGKWALASGYTIHYVAEAPIYHIHREAWHQVFNRYRREAIAAFRIGLARPPQARLEFRFLLLNLLGDVLASFPNWGFGRLEEIGRFRYYQFKGSRQGWYKDQALDMDRDKYRLLYSSNSGVVISSPGRASLVELPVPLLKPGDLLLRVEYAGVCHTDVEVYEGTLGYYKNKVAKYPIIPGHEFVGTIVQIGANPRFRERFKIGGGVVAESILSRGEGGERREVGVINYNGAYSELMVVPGDKVHRLPEGLSLKEAALAEPLAVVLRALRRLRPRLTKGERVAVMGAGPIGNFLAQVLSKEGYEVSVFDKNERRLTFLKGIVALTNSGSENLGEFGAVVETTGSLDVARKVLRDSRVGAKLLMLGLPYGNMDFSFEEVVGGDKEIIGSLGADREDFFNALRLLPHLKTEPLTKTILPLSEFKKAWELLRKGEHLKVFLRP